MSENNPEPPIRVFLLLQNRLLRDALTRLFRKRPDLLVVGASNREGCTPESVCENGCDVLVLDALDARWFPRNLQVNRDDLSKPKLLLICMKDEADEFLEAVHGGASGYLSKNASTSELLSAVRAVSRGEAVCPPKLCAALFQMLCRTGEMVLPHSPRAVLTLRQLRLMALVAKGMTNKEIASRLNLSELTVRNHVHRVMKRLRAENRSEAVRTVLSQGYSLTTTSSP